MRDPMRREIAPHHLVDAPPMLDRRAVRDQDLRSQAHRPGRSAREERALRSIV
jgi:hypothetical protein